MRFSIKKSGIAQKMAESMSVRELLNQVVCPAVTFLNEENIHPFGGAFFFPQEIEELRARINGFINKCTIPPLIVSDFENGPGNMIPGATKFTNMMGCSQAGSEELAYEMGRIAAVEGRSLGYNWTLAPVADLAAEMDCPMTSVRSAGNDPDHVIKILSAYIKGLQENGMMATIKHFPGDGFGTLDQHLTTPVNSLSMDEWYNKSGKVFKALIELGAMAVMPGHISLPAFDEVDPELGLFPPASLSSRLLTDLLRGELGFEGLIISDAINMGGAVGFMRYYEACARYFECGGDMLLFPKINEAFYSEMEALVEKGVLKKETLIDRAARIISLKEQLGLFNAKKESSPIELNSSHHREISRKMAEECITIVRDRKGLVPFDIKANTRILHLVILRNYESHKEIIDKFTEEIKKYTDSVDEIIDPGPENIFEKVYSGKYDLVICSIGSDVDYGINVARYHGPIARNMMDGWMKLGTPVIFVSHNHPFIHKEYQAAIDTMINTYGSTLPAIEYLVKGIKGDVQLKRQLLVHD